MSNNQTNWILKLVDQITGPMRNITAATTHQADAIEDVQQRVRLSQRDTRQALENEKTNRGELIQKIKEQEKVLHDLEDAMTAVAPGKMLNEANEQFAKANAKLQDYRNALKGTEDDIKDLSNDLNNFQQQAGNWDRVATGVNQFTELVEKVSGSLDFATEIQNTQTNIQRMTNATGPALQAMTGDVHRLGKVFHESDDEITIAANSMAKQMNISFGSALGLMQQGFEKGANVSGEFLDILKEYPAKMHDAGVSAEQFIAIQTYAAKNGIYADKMIDSVGEAAQALREMDQAQQDALAGIGLGSKDLAGKTGFEMIQTISKAIDTAGLTVQQKQKAITDIFKSAGEDGGWKMIEAFGKVPMNLADQPNVKQAGAGMNAFMADMQTWVANAFGSSTSYVTGFATSITGLSSLFGIMGTVKGMLAAQTVATEGAAVAQNGLNLAMINNPIGWTVAGLAALTGGIALAWQKSEGFRQVVFGLWETFKQVFTNISGLFKAVFSPIGEAITAIQEGRYMDAAKAAVKMNPASMAMAAAQYAASGGLTNGVSQAWETGQKKGAESWANSQEEGSEGGLLTRTFDKDQNQNKDKSLLLDGIIGGNNGAGKGLEISGSGGNKSITMNLEIKQYFNNINSKLDIRKVADEVCQVISDRIGDTLVTGGR